jgi:hypothetical protein
LRRYRGRAVIVGLKNGAVKEILRRDISRYQLPQGMAAGVVDLLDAASVAIGGGICPHFPHGFARECGNFLNGSLGHEKDRG